MKVSKSRWIIILLSFLSLILSLTIENKLIALLMTAVCILAAVVILYRHLDELTDISEDNPKMKTLKAVTVFNTAIFVICIAAVLLGTGVLKADDDGRHFAAVIVSSVILFAGNIAPKLPFSRHTGLRLPWTVTDEETWTVAHRILGYISIPLVLVYIAGTPAVPDFKLWTLAVILLWIGIPGSLSYVFYRRKK